MTDYKNDISFARMLDKEDPLAEFRNRFHISKHKGKPTIYLTGNSLGLQPKSTCEYVEQELTDWQDLGVEGHLHARNPWLPYHEFLTPAMSRIVGARAGEVVMMNTLSVNLHLLMVSFYRPTANRNKILIEANAFPSDQYAVASQIRFHGFDPKQCLLELPLREGEVLHHQEDIDALIEAEGDSIALILIGGVNYYTGQVFDMERITRIGQNKGCVVGFDLAHGAGNIPLSLHDWGVDFAAWCSYKYLNSGPGSISGVFVHERHANADLPRFAGWWGHNKKERFLMKPGFDAIPGAEGWQLSNPPILSLAAIRASLAIFDEAGMGRLRQKGLLLSGYLNFLLDDLGDAVTTITPRTEAARGCQVSIVVQRDGRRVFDILTEEGVICDWREPDVIRTAAVPLYNSFEDIWQFVNLLRQAISRA